MKIITHKLRLIDATELSSFINDVWDWDNLNVDAKSAIKQTIQDISNTPTIEAIPIDWMRKELVEMQFENEIKEDVMKALFKLIGNWRKFNGEL